MQLQIVQPSISRHSDLLSLITNGLQRYSEQATAISLGDRSAYIGLSDIGRFLECPRAALANKLFSVPHTELAQLLTLQRGHWFEVGIGPAIETQHPQTLQQLEIEVSCEEVPLKAHLDFVLMQDVPQPVVRVVEVKSMSRLPDNLYASHEVQVYGQLGLLRLVWNQPAFSLQDAHGTPLYQRLTFPQLCKAHFGITLPPDPSAVVLEASVLALSMTDAKAFGPYLPNKGMLELCLRKATELWKFMETYKAGTMGINELDYAKGFHPLCEWCDWNFDCPKFADAEFQPEWTADLQRLATLKQSCKSLNVDIDELEQGLKDAYALSAANGNWINTTTHRFRVTPQAGRTSLNREQLRWKLAAIMDEARADALLERCSSEGAPFMRLTVSKINNKGA